jgi:dihydrofolate synthase / folylpolyglutamate synthase
MTYAETLSHIFALARFGIKPGLERITRLLAALGNPQDSFATVHVVGTNGKGSTAATLSSLLSAGNYRTGLFTSPHLISFTERMRVDGTEISQATVAHLAQRVLAAAPEETTFFEIVTALAVLHFAETNVQLAVFEAGMGGRLDATNALNGRLAIVTPVALDHTEYLGGSLAEIAAEKAGIAKPGRPIVSARQEPEVARVIGERARALGATLAVEGEQFAAHWEQEALDYRGLQLTLSGLHPGLSGSYQSGNLACALAAAELLSADGFPLKPQAFRTGLAGVSWPGRLELFPGPPRLILDGAHNPAGAQALAGALALFPRRRLFLVVGVMGDKELSGVLGPLLPLADRVFAVAPALERALPADRLAQYCRAAGKDAVAAQSVADGIEQARAEAAGDDLVVVCGSLFTVGEARGILLSRTSQLFRG